jgi:hypothetical protein
MSSEISFKRVWAMPNKETFSIEPIRCLIAQIHRHEWLLSYDRNLKMIDPFARNSPFNQNCIATNDLSPEANTTHHLESLEFLKLFDDSSIDMVLFDPPYSPRQISECYKSIGREVHMKDTQSSFYGDRKDEVARVLKLGGKAICCGWNSNGIGIKRGFELEHVLIVPHGGAHNDTIVTVERKVK